MWRVAVVVVFVVGVPVAVAMIAVGSGLCISVRLEISFVEMLFENFQLMWGFSHAEHSNCMCETHRCNTPRCA